MTILVYILQCWLLVFQEYGWEVLNHPLYSPDLSPLDYDLFPKLNEPLQGIYFSDLSELGRDLRDLTA